MQKSEAAAYLAGVKQVEGAQASAPTNLHVVTGEVGETSEDGTTTINIDGIVFSESDDQYIEMDTLGGLEEGDIATVILTGEQGHGMTPLAIGAPGSVDRVRNTAIAAGEVASAASAVANATAQHVWIDDNGLHVTEVEQDEWNEQHSGMNVLLNALGQLFRIADNPLLGLLSGQNLSVVIYDGTGDTDANVVARFASNLIALGDENAEIKLCGDKGVVKYDSEKALPFQILGEENVFIGTSLRSGCNVSIVDSSNYKGVSLYADEISLEGYTLSVDPRGDSVQSFPMASVANAIPVTLYDNADASASASVTLSETAANFKRFTIFFRDSDNNFSSVDVWSPNGKRVALSLTWINGASTQEMYQRVRWVTISGTTISTSKLSGDAKYRTGQVKLGATSRVTNSDYITITHVIGYR